MIKNLAVTKTANFFRARKKLSNKMVETVFTTLRSNYGVKTNNIFKHTRKVVGNARWSAICFVFENSPAFLNSTSGVKETLCGYLMLVEYKDHVAVFSSRIGLPAVFKSEHFDPLPIDSVEGAIATENAIFHKIHMRNMSVSQYVMRSKTLEAPNLANVVGPAGSRRYAPQSYLVTTAGVQTKATPSTGRIGVRSDRVGQPELVDFATAVIDALLITSADVSPFIRSFARPMSLADALSSSQPVTLAIDTNKLTDAALGDDAMIRLVRTGGELVTLTATEVGDLAAELDKALNIEEGGRRRSVRVPGVNIEAAAINLNSSRIALRSLTLGGADQIQVESLQFPLGGDPDRKSLQQYLDEENAFIVLFSDMRLSYIDGQVFRDETLLGGGEAFLRYLHADAALQSVTSEKGRFFVGQTSFDSASMFSAVVDNVASTDTTLVCDDLGDEWADFVGIKEFGGLTQISFYHAKHGALELSAASFHVSVSQAIKNLGNMSLPEDRMASKIRGWSGTYKGPGQATQIPRTVRSSGESLADTFASARTAPDAMRRAVIVTSSLSKQAVADVFAAMQNGHRPSHAFVQLYWLLQSFFSACSEVGAVGSIVCQP